MLSIFKTLVVTELFVRMHDLLLACSCLFFIYNQMARKITIGAVKQDVTVINSRLCWKRRVKRNAFFSPI